MNTTLFKIDIDNQIDIITLENKIRHYLHCESATVCGFLQSAPYKQMVMSILLRLNHVLSFDEEIRLFFGYNTMVLIMHTNAKTVEIKKKELAQVIIMADEGEDENPDYVHIDQRRRKYPRKNQEEAFVAKYVHSRLHQPQE